MKIKGMHGFTLLEVLIASVVAAILLAGMIHFMMAGMGVNSRCLAQGSVQEQARRAMEMLVRELKDSGESCTGWAVGVDPSPSTQYYDQEVSQLSFSRCTGYDPAQDMLSWGPVVTYRYEGPQGMETGKLMRREGAAETAVCSGVSSFLVLFRPDTAQFDVTLIVESPDPTSRGHTIRSSLHKVVKLRND